MATDFRQALGFAEVHMGNVAAALVSCVPGCNGTVALAGMFEESCTVRIPHAS